MKSQALTLSFTGVAAAFLIFSVAQPLWHLRMEAPQYQAEEALKVHVYPNGMRGDLSEINVLNQYIGVHVPATLPQFRWLPGVLMAAAAAGIAAALLPGLWRKRGLIAVPVLLSLALAGAAVQAQKQMYDIGHKRDAKTKMARTKDFTPPLLGTARLANFTLTARLGMSAYLISAAIALQLGAGWLNHRQPSQSAKKLASLDRNEERSLADQTKQPAHPSSSA